MAKNFQRHSRGGTFRKQNFGDLGLSAFKEQQDQIIDSLKLQQARSREYGNEYASGLSGVAASEEKNRNILNTLENRIFENRRKNVEKKGLREVQNIEGQAKELGKASEFWKDFSTTYSKQLGQAAQGLSDLQQSMAADAQLQEWLENGKFDQLAEFGDKAQTLTEKKLSDRIAASWKKGNTEEVELGHNIFKSGNRFLTKQVVAKLKENHDAHFGAFKDFINNNEELEWTEDTIPQLAQFRARQLIQEFGLENSKAGRELYNFWTSKGESEARKVRELNNAVKGDKEIGAMLEYVADNRSPEAFQQLLYTVDRSTRTNDRGEALAAFNNGPQSLLFIANKLDFPSDMPISEQVNTLMDTPFMGGVRTSKGKWSEGTFDTRNKKEKNIALRKELEEILIKKKIQDIKATEDALQADGATELVTLEGNLTDPGTKEAPNKNFIDLTTEEGWEKGIKLLKTYKPYMSLEEKYNPYKRLANAFGLKPGTINPNSVDYQLTKAYAIGDKDDFSRLWSLLDKEGKTRHESKHATITILRNGGGDHKTIEKRAKDAVKEQSKIRTLDEKTHPTGVRIAKILEQGFIHEFNKLDRDKYEGKVPNWEVQMVEDAWGAATKDFNAKKGLYESTETADAQPGSGVSKRIYHFGEVTPGRNTNLTIDQIRKLPYEEVQFSSTLNLPDNLISENQTGYLANAIQSKKAVTIPEGLTLYAQLQGRPVTEVVNQWLKSKKYSQQLDYNYHDYAMLKSEQFQIDIRHLDPWSGIAVTEYGSVIKENPEFRLNLMTPEVRKKYEQMRGPGKL